MISFATPILNAREPYTAAPGYTYASPAQTWVQPPTQSVGAKPRDSDLVVESFPSPDIFSLGLGFDIGGAYLLAQCLIPTPEQMARRRKGYADFSGPLAVAQASDRMDAMFGLGALFLGFSIQAAEYVAALAGAGGAIGATPAVVGALAVFVGAAVVIPGAPPSPSAPGGATTRQDRHVQRCHR